ncbi:MarR family winged helix-turn-helix transcriptional regulator [Paenibacillus xerothermodurans]|nr:MarR family transcriptional regulator [Paenibacillus xerothermodurans]
MRRGTTQRKWGSEIEQPELESKQLFRSVLRKMSTYCRYTDKRFSASQVCAREVLHAQGSIKITDLADTLSLSMSAVTLLSDKLIAQDCVTRQRSAEDRRVVCLAITERGQSTLRDITERENKIVGEWLAGLPDSDLRQFNRIFQHILANAKTVE